MKTIYNCLNAKFGTVLLMAILTTNIFIVKSQNITNYSFSATAGTFAPLIGPDTATLSGGTNDEGYYNTLPIGFNYTYMGVTYSDFSASTNGWMTFGQVITSASLTNSLTSGGNRPVIAPLWDNIDMTSGVLSYQTVGTSGNQILTVEWLNVEWYNSAIAPVLSFQVKLYEATGAIEFIYQQEAGAIGGTVSASIGITGTGTLAGNYLSLNNSGTAPSVSSTTATTNINTKPANGQTYTFTPPVGPVVPPVSFTASPIGISSMTVSFVDNSLTESGFYVYRSLDNFNFTLVGTIPTTTASTTGTSYSLNQAGLTANTLYYYNIVTFNEAWLSSALNGNATTLPATFCGNRTVGPTGNYSSLTAAFADIALNGLQCSSILELEAAYLSTVESFPITIPHFGNSTTTTLTVRPEAAATGLMIISDTTETFILDGAIGLIFDGRPGGSGTSELTIENTRITGLAISLMNGASYNNFQALTIKGVNNSVTGGVISFLTSTLSSGNNFNIVQNNNICDGASTPNNLVYSAGSASAPNTGNSVVNNNLFNFFNPASSSAAIYVAANNSAWTISNNKVYQNSARTYTTGTLHYGIRVVSSSGINFTINNNSIGYSSKLATGVYIMEATNATRFSAISLTADEASPSNIQGNTINNISLKTSSSTSTGIGVFSGIAVLGGSVNIGTTSANLIGSAITNDSINIISTSSGGSLVGIYSTSSGTVNISNNKIGGLSASGTPAIGNTVRGINTAGSGSYTILGNEIGSLTLADNIRAGVFGTTTGSTDLTGIENSSSGTHTISGNTVNNLSSFGTGTSGQVRGISSTSGVVMISNNSISYLSSAAGVTGTTATASVIGISKSGTSADQSVSGNTILNLSNTSVAAAITINGIYYTGSSTGTNLITNNTIQNLSAATTGLGLVNGIYVGGGASTFANNMITLGLDSLAASITSGNLSFNGIRLATTAANNFYFNSVHITGSNVTTGTASSHGFIRTLTGITEIKNNIFANTRLNSTGSGTHYSINLNLTTTVTAGNNDYYFPNGMMGVVGTTDYPLLGNWKIGTALDLSSIRVDPMFISSTDLHINNSTPSSLESGGVVVAGISTDFDIDSRPGPVGSINGGGTKPDIGADEFDGSPIGLDMGATVLVSPLTTDCYGATETVRVRIKNYAGAAMDFSSNPISVNVAVAGPNPVVFTPVDIYSGTLASGATLDTTISTAYNMNVAGQYIFKASTVLAGDANNGNDSMAVVTVDVTAGAATASSLTICNGGSTVLTLSGNNGTVQWQNSIDGGTVWNNETGISSTTETHEVFPEANIKYRALVCNQHSSDTLDVNVLTIPGPATVGAVRCGPGAVSLSASGSGTLLWYDAPAGGTIVNTGLTYAPSILASTSYYVSDVAGGVSERVGKTNQGTSSFISALKYGVLFTAVMPAIIDSVNVYPTGTGTITIQILDPSTQAVLYSAAPFALSGSGTQKIAVPVGIVLPPGDYKMSMTYTGLTNIVRTTSGGPFPYTSPSGAVSITSGATGTGSSTSYYWFYDWVITTGCESLRTQVTATMTAPPAMSISATNPVFCIGDSTTISMSSANTYSYTWSPAGSLNTATGASVVAIPALTTKYYVNAIDGTSCANIDSITITVNALPALTLTSAPSAICLGSSSQISGRSMHLASTLMDENFNVTPTSWTITNTSTPLGLEWAFVADFEGNTMNGTPFAFVDSDSPGSGTIVNSTLTSPLINSSGNDSLVLSFDQYYRHLSSTIATIEIFDGIAWIQVYQPTATTGSWTTSNIRNIDITPYANSNMQIRFNYFGNWDYYWAIDNIKISTFMNNNFNWTGNGLSSTNISNPVATPVLTTMYNLIVTDPSTTCVLKDSIEITVNSNPIVNLGVDTAICSNLSLILDAGNYTDYVWSTTATTQTVTVNTAATYSVTVTDANGCTGSDAVNVTINAAPVISLGVDSIICDGQSVALSPGIGFIDYNWSTGASTSVISAVSANDYSVIVTDINQCKGYDTVGITVNTLPVVSLGSDIGFCENDSSILDAGLGFVSYTWSDGTTLQTATVSTAGPYSVTVTDNNGCANSDEIMVVVNALPVVNLGTDITFCVNDSVILDAGNGFSNYNWSDNSVLQTLTVSTAGTYSVIVTDNNGCINSDEIIAGINALPLINLGTDVAFCMNDSIILDAGNGFNTYAWSDNSASQTLTVSTAGTYSVIVTDNNGCNNSDAISITVNSLPVMSLGIDTVICKDEIFIIDAGSGFSSYLWNNSATTQSIVVDGAALAAGNYTYSLIVAGSNGCEATDTITVQVDLCAGINEEKDVAVFYFYPNPSQGEFTITTTSSVKNDIVVEVVDIEGRVIYKEKINQFTSKSIQLNNPAPGIYFVKILDSGNSRIQKLIIN